ncbi:GDSL esterase/lipase [Euphorbia peplus]|nr:GDSL esterase/lipase [Euphorbia peplus]
MFVFGSSLADNGVNAFLNTIAKPITLPYGVDFPFGPTGRFTNGKTIIDFFSKYLNFPNFLPPFGAPTAHDDKILNGIDYASGSSGILDETGSQVGQVASLSVQMSNFVNTTLPELEKLLGMKSEQFLGDYMFFVASGANDIGSNYHTRHNQTLEFFVSHLSELVTAHIKNLYRLGGRKFAFMAVYPIGCYPVGRVGNGCNETANNNCKAYNVHLKAMIDNLPKELPGSHFVYVNGFDILAELTRHPTRFGIKDGQNTCCEVIRNDPTTGGSGCKRSDHPIICPNRSDYVFFDGAHTSEAANQIIANKAFHSRHPSVVYPINLSQLANI